MGAGFKLEWPTSAALEDGTGVMVAGARLVHPLRKMTIIVTHKMVNTPKRLKDNHCMTVMR